jgi:hypothetical protein
MVSLLFIAIGMLMQTLRVSLFPYFMLAGILILIPSYTIRFFSKYYKRRMDYLKLVFVFFWSTQMILNYLQSSHWSLLVVQAIMLVFIGRFEMKTYAKSITGFSKSAKHSFILFSIVGLVAASGTILQLIGIEWAYLWIASGFTLGIVWLLKGWMRL